MWNFKALYLEDDPNMHAIITKCLPESLDIYIASTIEEAYNFHSQQSFHLTTLTKEQKEYVTIVENSSEHLLSLINDVLDLSKIEAQELTLAHAPFNFKDHLKRLTELFSWQLQEKQITLQTEIDDSIPIQYMGDASRVYQILINTVGNAIKFTKKGTITISLSKNNLNPHGNLLLKVKDTGIGIPEDKQAKIFEAFNQGENSVSKKFGGTGLGLSITKKLVHLMGGDIWVESQEGMGSTFFMTLSLPVVQIEQQENFNQPFITKEDLAKLKSKPLKILLVDDAINNRNLIIAYLKNFPFEIIEAQNGIEVLEFLKNQDFDLVFMDIHMPEKDGYTAIKLFRNWEKEHSSSKLPVIALTAYALQEEQTKYHQAGFDEHLSKPIKKDTVIQAIYRRCA
jgi:two-component system, sensor histidine kinase